MWESARVQTKVQGYAAILVLDEIQKIPDWAGTVKQLWDEDTRRRVPLRVVVLGSAPRLVARGLKESLAGRFEILHLPHWTPGEMRKAFGWPVDKSIFFGGYPGAAPLATDETRWARYIRDSLIETTSGMARFSKLYPKAKCLLVGGDGIALDDFLTQPPEQFLESC